MIHRLDLTKLEPVVPMRVQRSRAKGWKMPPNTVYVGRPSTWGNPFIVADGVQPRDAVNQYRAWLYRNAPNSLIAIIQRNLRGKHLACWCPIGQPCHGDVLLELANRALPTPTPTN